MYLMIIKVILRWRVRRKCVREGYLVATTHDWFGPAYRQFYALVSTLEAAEARGETALVRSNLRDLQEGIDAVQRCSFELANLQYRACIIRDEHQ